MVAKSKTKIMVVDFKNKKLEQALVQENHWEVDAPGETTQTEEHMYCGACELCDSHKVVCRSGECGACEDCLEFPEISGDGFWENNPY